MLNILLPIAGRGSRFAEAGYTLPKPLIPLDGKPMIQWVVENLRPTRPHRFIFAALREHLEQSDLGGVLERIEPGATIVPVEGVTEGAACTVLLAKAHLDSADPLMIANTDQYVDQPIDDYLEAFDASGADGFIMTFTADHPKWSYVRFGADGRISEVVEKQVVSNEATVGIYNFRHGSAFIQGAEAMIRKNLRVNGEFYVAPAYNELIAQGSRLGIYNIDRQGTGMHGLGTPEDLNTFLASPFFQTLGGR
jgi:NDP-sugar pyrophosphorylase family protein